MLIRVTYDPPRQAVRPGVQQVAVGTILEPAERGAALLVKSWVRGGHVEQISEGQAREVYGWKGSQPESSRVDIAGVEFDAHLPLR